MTGADAGSGRRQHGRRPVFTAVLLVAVMVTGYFLLPLDGLGPERPRLSWALFIVVLGAIASLILRQIGDILRDRPDVHPALVIPVLMCLAILVFAGTYFVLARHPGEVSGLHTRLDALYFTLVTVATIGYGDITPQGQTARLVAILQILYTFVFLTAAAASLSRRVQAKAAARPGRHEDR
ncbi:potassium channel family protein [Streptomyces sp. NPDC001606]